MTNIEWTDCTDNIITVKDGGWWCRKIGGNLSGCDNCYAAILNQNSFFGGNKLPYSGKMPELILKRDILKSWPRQTKPKKHFVSSMTDVFGEWTYFNWHHEMLDAMWGAPKQTFQILTKRPHIMRDACLQWMKNWDLPRMPDNIWLGATVENQATADKRIPILLEIPAAIRFLSCEPLLESIDLSKVGITGDDFYTLNCLNGEESYPGSKRKGIISPINWVIAGGESGKGARVCHIDWVRSLVHQCQSAHVPVFVKQLGSNPVFSESDYPSHFPHHYITGKGGDLDEFPEELRIREFPSV